MQRSSPRVKRRAHADVTDHVTSSSLVNGNNSIDSGEKDSTVGDTATAFSVSDWTIGGDVIPPPAYSLEGNKNRLNIEYLVQVP